VKLVDPAGAVVLVLAVIAAATLAASAVPARGLVGRAAARLPRASQPDA
jgi:hypothetical protein